MKSTGKIIAGLAAFSFLGFGTAVLADDMQEMRDVSAFTKIKNKGPFEVYVTIGGEQSVKITADSDVMDKIETEVRGETLTIEIEAERGWWRNNRVGTMRVDITVPSLEAASVNGSGDLEITGFNGGDFDANVNGSGNISLMNAVVGDLSIDVKGSGDVTASGTCDELDVEVKGSGDVSARDMQCASGDVGIMGSGDVDVHLNDSIDVAIMGSGDVNVWGNPGQVKSRTMGSGDVTLK